METILSGYTINRELPSIHKNIKIFDAVRAKDDHPVIIKLLKDKNPSLEEIEQFKNEYQILKLLRRNKFIPQVLGFEKIEHSYAIILDKIEGFTLQEMVAKKGSLSLDEFFNFVIKIAEILSQLHDQHIIHLDINPSNIIYDPKNDEIYIIGFGAATKLSNQKASTTNPNRIEGELKYISPEQTGRMNRSIDYRSDYYSLGATFYHLLSGYPPFQLDSPMKLIYHHIAVLPEPLNKVNQEVPEIVANIVQKLMAKTAEERYQSASGLIHDLEKCQEMLATEFQDFLLGQKDVYSSFHMPEKLYGRDRELEILLKTYEKASKGRIELILVEGYAGIGKTSLVHELYKPITQQGGYFLSGKFDQFKHHIPYAAMIQALNEWVQKILTEDNRVIEDFKNRILKAVKGNGQVILDVIPQLENIIGPQPELPQMEQIETQNRFHQVFQAFISAIATEDYPMVMFLDDLQWADLPSLNILESLLTSLSCKHILIIGAYRSNEIDESHPLVGLLERLNKRSVIYGTIALGPLSLEHVTEIIGDLVHRHDDKVKELAEVCYQKTNGNPFFLLQLLKTLHEENLLVFDTAQNYWVWEIEKIQEKGVSDNVVDLMINRIQQLPQELSDVLQYSACLGNRFNLKLLSHITKKPVERLFIDMQELLENGFIVSGGHQKEIQMYQFAHDRIQQAAHSILDEIKRNEIHLELARYILRNTKKENINDVIFEIIDHYNFCVDSQMTNVMDTEERLTIANLNLQAAKLAKAASAYDPQLKYVEYALYVLDENILDANYNLMMDLYTEACEASYLSGKHKLMEYYADLLAKNSKSVYDEVKTIQTKVFSYTSQEKHSKALDVIIEALKRLGTKLPRHPNQVQILMAVMKVKFSLYMLSLRGKKISDLLDLPEMTDHTKRIVIGLLKTSYSPAYLGEPDLFAILVCEAILISLKYGNAKDSAYPYICYGMICCDILKDIDTGYALGEMANALNIKMRDEETATKLNLVLAGFIRPWKDSIRSILPDLLKAYERGFENGDLEYGCYGAYINIAYSFFAGMPIKPLMPKIEAFEKRFNSLQLTQSLQFLHMTHEGILPFIENVSIPFPDLKDVKDISILFNTYNFRLMHSFYFEDFEVAHKSIQLGKKYTSIVAWQGVPVFHFYEALTLLQEYPEKPTALKRKTINKNLKKLQFWAKHAPANHTHKVLLLEAEIAHKIKKDKDEALKLYWQAIEVAKRNEYLHEEALANELLAKFYIAQGNKEQAKEYLNDALYCYHIWGSDTKYEQLLTKYADIIDRTNLRQRDQIEFNVSEKLQKVHFDNIDAVSESLETFFDAVIEFSGAQKGLLIGFKHDTYTLLAEKTIVSNVILKNNKPLEPHIVPLSMINYIDKTKETVVIDDAVTSEHYSFDPYVTSNKAKSILALPLIQDDNFYGILYLENNLTNGAFTKTRLNNIIPIAIKAIEALNKKETIEPVKV